MSRVPPYIEQIIDGKRVEGFEVLPLIEAGIRYEISEVQLTDENSTPTGLVFFVSAFFSDGSLKWKTQFHSQEYEPFLETDVQDDYVVDFYIEGGELIIKLEYYSEHDRVFSLSKDDGVLK